jgi:hypothetical protein
MLGYCILFLALSDMTFMSHNMYINVIGLQDTVCGLWSVRTPSMHLGSVRAFEDSIVVLVVSGETNPLIWDSNPNESLDDFEKDSYESDSNPNPKNRKKDSSLNKS